MNKPLAQEQLKLIDPVIADLDRLYRGGELSINDARFSLWERRRVDALREAGAGKAEVVAALERYVKRMKDVDGFTKTLYEKNQATRVDTLAAKYERLEAEIWLNREKAR